MPSTVESSHESIDGKKENSDYDAQITDRSYAERNYGS